MAEDARALAEAAWQGDRAGVEAVTRHPGRVLDVADGVAVMTGFGNSMGVRAGDGRLLIDTSSRGHGPAVLAGLRAWDTALVHTVIYTHGHFDHVGGMPFFDEEAERQGRPRPHVIGHENLPRRLDRYTLTSGYNAIVNARQYGPWPWLAGVGDSGAWRAWRYPDETYRDRRTLTLGGDTFELIHGKGETDDHTWVWDARRRIVYAGDLFVWRSPNAGNPQKVQRFPREWAQALRQMAELEPEVLLPSHYVPVYGRERVGEALDNTARLLETLVDQTLELMNQGARLDQIIHEVKAPAELLEKPYLEPLYDEPEFIVRNIWRLYGGWHDGNPANLKPAPEAALAAELASLAGGAGRLAARARGLVEAGEHRLACHLVEMASLAARDDPEVRAARHDVYMARLAVERSLMAQGIFRAAAGDPTSPARP